MDVIYFTGEIKDCQAVVYCTSGDCGKNTADIKCYSRGRLECQRSYRRGTGICSLLNFCK